MSKDAEPGKVAATMLRLFAHARAKKQHELASVYAVAMARNLCLAVVQKHDKDR